MAKDFRIINGEQSETDPSGTGSETNVGNFPRVEPPTFTSIPQEDLEQPTLPRDIKITEK